MQSKVGLWIDHRKAVMVFLTDGEEEVREIVSHMEKHVRFSGDSSEEGSADDIRDRQFAGHLDRFYDDVIAYVHDADSILIFGPGEAKDELAKRLESKGHKRAVSGIETADKMTDRQIAARVRRHFHA
jgi:stalled ribosome rescue protein Dom34